MSSKVGGIARAPVWGANPFLIMEYNKINNGKADSFRISFLNLAFLLSRPPFTEYSMTGDL